MSEIAESAPGEESRSKKWWLAVLLTVLCVGWFLYQLFGPNEPIRISRETTFITEPLTPDGLPDYEAYLLNYGRAGVTPENNAAVPLWQALWPGDLSPEDEGPLMAVLGMPETPSVDPTVQSLYASELKQDVVDWLYDTLKPAADDLAEGEELPTEDEAKSSLNWTAEEAIEATRSRPWRTEQFPWMARWIEENRQSLDLLVEASRREKFWSPSPSLVNEKHEGIIAMLLPEIQSMRTAARALAARAMWHVGEGRPAEGWQDVYASHRLARFMKGDATLIGQLVGLAISGIACEQTVILLHHGQPDAELARQILKDLTDLGEPSDMLTALDQGERIMFLDTVMLVAKRPEEFATLTTGGAIGSPQDELLRIFASLRMEWNDVLKVGNEWYDRLVELGRKSRAASSQRERDQLFEQFYGELNQASRSIDSPVKVLPRLFSTRGRTDLLSNLFVALMLPALDGALKAEIREETSWRMTQIAAALQVHRAEHGEYPASLVVLAPDILPQLPLDPYSGKAFLYERKPDGGYLLYSVFENGEVDGGNSNDEEIMRGEWKTKEQNENPQEEDFFDYDKTDLVIRVPFPPFTLPEWPKSFQGEYGGEFYPNAE